MFLEHPRLKYLIKYAKKEGYYVISCDRKIVPALNIVMKAQLAQLTKIFELSKKLKIDGIVTYVSDAASPTVSYVSKKLNLNGLPIKTVDTLVNKDLFRKFLKK